jgi:oligopeptide transport system substrate-binding protein
MKKRGACLSYFVLLLAVLLSLLAPGCTCEQPLAGGTLKLWDSGPITLDPAISGDISSHTFVTQVFSGLVLLDENLNVKPDIAESWQKSDDGRTYTFYIRKNAQFHDGKKVTAADFKYSWERACNPDTGSTTAPMYLNDILGANDIMAGKAKQLSGAKVIDDYTLEVTIDDPKAYFLSKLAYPTSFVVDQANVASGQDWFSMRPNGAGPFKLKRWDPGREIIMERNDAFYREKPVLDALDFQILSGMPNDLYEVGKIDVTRIDHNYIDIARDPRGPFPGELKVSPELSFNYIGFNVEKPPFDDINVRKAFCYAVDRDKILKVILKDTVHKAGGILPPGIPGYDQNLAGYDFNPDKARAALAASKYGSSAGLPPVVITISGIGNSVPEVLGAIIQSWQDNLGVSVSVHQVEPRIFMYNFKNEVDNLFELGWIADYPDPQNFTDNLFRTGYAFNMGGYSNKDIDAAMEKASVEQNPGKRTEMYRKIDQALMDDAAVLPLWNGINYYLVKPYVKNYKMNGLGMPSFTSVTLTKANPNIWQTK